MKFLCLAYGDEDGWNSLSKDEQREVLAQDAVSGCTQPPRRFTPRG